MRKMSSQLVDYGGRLVREAAKKVFFIHFYFGYFTLKVFLVKNNCFYIRQIFFLFFCLFVFLSVYCLSNCQYICMIINFLLFAFVNCFAPMNSLSLFTFCQLLHPYEQFVLCSPFVNCFAPINSLSLVHIL